MIISELLRLRYSLAGRVLLAILLSEAIFVGLLLAFLPNLIDALIILNEVIPNATSADQFTDGQLAALTLASPQFQVLIADVLGNAGLGASLPVIAATLVGALTITSEFRRGSITGAVLAQPIRWRLIAAKMTAFVCAVTAAAIILAVVRVGILGVGLAVQGQPLLIELPDLAIRLAFGILSLVLYSLLGLGIGLLIRNQVATISVIFAGIAIESIIRPLALLYLRRSEPHPLPPLRPRPRHRPEQPTRPPRSRRTAHRKPQRAQRAHRSCCVGWSAARLRDLPILAVGRSRAGLRQRTRFVAGDRLCVQRL